MPRLQKTLADYVTIAVSPVLIMMLVGSLVFFLQEVFYQGRYDSRVNIILGLFVMAIVLIGRISIEGGNERAVLFAVPLAIVVGLAIGKFSGGGWLHWGLMALCWWSAHKLTWDCTVIDEDKDASGQGLLQIVGLDGKGQTEFETPEKVPGEEKEAAPSYAPVTASWEAEEKKKRKPHAPGVWIVYFSLAALPLFGIGQRFIPMADVESRRHAFTLLLVYVASGLGLLLTTSFLGLRRYLRQRQVEMPPSMAAVWIASGGVLIAVLLLFAALLPRPAAEYAISKVPLSFGSPQRKSSKYAMGNDGADQNSADSKSATTGDKPQSDDEQSDDEQSDEAKNSSGSSDSRQRSDDDRQPSPDDSQSGGESGDDKSKPGDSGKPSDEGKGDSGKSSGQGKPQEGKSQEGKSQQDKSSEQDRQRQGKSSKQGKQDDSSPDDSSRSDDSDKSDKAADSSQKSSQEREKSGEPSDRDTEQESSLEPDDGQSSDREEGSDDKDEEKSDRSQSREQQTTQDEREKESPPSSFSFQKLLSSLMGALGAILKWLFYIAILLIALYWLIRSWKTVTAAWAQFLKEMAELWRRLFGGKPTPEEEAAAAVEESKPAPRPFADFADPFATGMASRYSPDELVKYTFEAVEAWARENGLPRGPEQTPHEFARRLSAAAQSLEGNSRRLADLYCYVAYAPGRLRSEGTKPLAQLWQELRPGAHR